MSFSVGVSQVTHPLVLVAGRKAACALSSTPSPLFLLQNRDARFRVEGPHGVEVSERFDTASFLGTSSFRGISAQDGRSAVQGAQTSRALC